MTVYQQYNLEALEIQYDIEATVESIDVYRIENTALSERQRETSSPLIDVAYGPSPLQTMDIFPAKSEASPIIVYIHGGYWLRGDKAAYGFPAKSFNQAGATWISVNYRLASEVKLDEIVSDVRDALAWVYNNAGDFGADQNRIYVVGSSAGAHLSAMIAASNWQTDYSLPEDVIKGVALCSGLYDLEPFRHTSQKDYLNLSPTDVQQNSPVQHLPRKNLPMLVSWAGQETDEFQRQSQHFAELCKENGNSVETLFYPDHNHFSLSQEFENAESDLVQGILKLSG
jgi:arylformamidase